MITIEVKGVDEVLSALDPRNVQLALRASINRAVQSGKSIASEEIRKVYNVKAGDLNPRLKTYLAAINRLSATLEITGRPMSLSYFGAKQITGGRAVSRGKDGGLVSKRNAAMRRFGPVQQGVMVQVLKGKPATLRHAFMARMKKSGHVGVFRRMGRASLPIDEKNVITIPSMVENAQVMPSVISRIQERLSVEFPRQLDYYMSRGK